MESSLPPSLEAFLADLVRQDLSANTRGSYRSDLLLFARWFSDTTDEAFSPTAVTPTDIREYRAYLINVERRAPTTVNRKPRQHLVDTCVPDRWHTLRLRAAGPA